jgi:hypothetical protein
LLVILLDSICEAVEHTNLLKKAGMKAKHGSVRGPKGSNLNTQGYCTPKIAGGIPFSQVSCQEQYGLEGVEIGEDAPRGVDKIHRVGV